MKLDMTRNDDPAASKDRGARSAESAADAHLETQVIAIEGMTCDRCVQIVRRALSEAEGVKDVQVDRGRAVATVTFDTRATDMPHLHEVLLQSGYKPTPSARSS